MGHVQGTFFTLKLDTFGSHRTLRQFMFWNVGYTLKVIVASIAKVSRTKAEKHCHTTTVATLVFQVVCTVFRTHLGPWYITAAPANQFFGVVVVTLSSVSRRFSTRCLNSASLDDEEDDDPVGLGSGQIKNHMTLLLMGMLNWRVMNCFSFALNSDSKLWIRQVQ